MNEKGYTLIEALIVLSILTILTSFMILQLKPLSDAKQIDMFFSQLYEDILYSQQYAISHNETMKILFYENLSSYRIVTGYRNDPILKRDFKQSIQIRFLTLGSTLNINKNGNIQKAGTLRVSFNNKSYKITFLLGRGRFYVVEL